MTKDKECKKMFKQILKGKENAGYVEWENWVLNEIKDYDKKQKQNVIKRYELKLDVLIKDTSAKLFSLVIQYVVIFTMLIPYLGSVLTQEVDSVINIGSDIINSCENMQLKQEYMSTMYEIVNDTGTTLLMAGRNAVVLLILLLVISKFIDMAISDYKKWNVIYYENLIEVLKNDD